jgi:RsiW-degrading membrane proteinase PrsW (M82 family)
MNFRIGKYLVSVEKAQKKREVAADQAEQMPERNLDWYIENRYLANMSLEEGSFLLQHAEKQLVDSLDTNKIIIDKTSSLLTLSAGIFIALSGFAVKRWSDGHADALLSAAIFGSIYMFLLCVFFIFIIKPKGYCIPGAEPKHFFYDALYEARHNGVNRMILFYKCEIESYQQRIKSNFSRNNERWTLYKIALVLLVAAPILVVLFYYKIKP